MKFQFFSHVPISLHSCVVMAAMLVTEQPKSWDSGCRHIIRSLAKELGAASYLYMATIDSSIILPISWISEVLNFIQLQFLCSACNKAITQQHHSLSNIRDGNLLRSHTIELVFCFGENFLNHGCRLAERVDIHGSVVSY